MTDWTAGYVSEIDYTYGYYAELNPRKIQLAFANAGLVFPTIGTACELGFGQGVSTNIHAAASTCEWYGTDFNPSQAGFAQELNIKSGATAKLYDESFSEFCSRKDLPDFDYICMHGIWSWISDENRQVIVDFLKRKLKVGGVLYISYNTLPGWSNFAPLRHVMTQYAARESSKVSLADRIDDAIEFVEKFTKLKNAHSQNNPSIEAKVKSIKSQNRDYIAHEYFNKDWHPMYFSAMNEWLSAAKLEYACSADGLETIDNKLFSEEQQQFLNTIADPIHRQTMRDFMLNQQFRKDYWVKGKRTITHLEKIELLSKFKFVLPSNPDQIPTSVKVSSVTLKLDEKIYPALFAAMLKKEVFSIHEISNDVKAQGISDTQVVGAITVLANAGIILSVADETPTSKVRQITSDLNNFIQSKSRANGDLPYLASPLTQGGIIVKRFTQLFLSAWKAGHKKPDAIAKHVYAILKIQNQVMQRNGAPLLTPEENHQELTTMAEKFIAEEIDIYKKLMII